MYPNIPYEGLSWPITQHAGVLKSEVFDGLLNACLLCKGETIDAEKINGYLVNNGILTANIRADSNQVDAWRDYQQILSEFGLIYSTRISKVLTLTPIAMAYLNKSLSYSELITLQLLRYQYPNGHKSQLSPSLVQSYGDNFNYESFTELQAHYNIQIRPAALVWKILYKLWESGEQPILSLDEMQSYAVRCSVWRVQIAAKGCRSCKSDFFNIRANDDAGGFFVVIDPITHTLFFYFVIVFRFYLTPEFGISKSGEKQSTGSLWRRFRDDDIQAVGDKYTFVGSVCFFELIVRIRVRHNEGGIFGDSQFFGTSIETHIHGFQLQGDIPCICQFHGFCRCLYIVREHFSHYR